MPKRKVKLGIQVARGLDKFQRPTAIGWNLHREPSVVIVGETVERQPGLVQLVDALNPFGAVADLGQRGEEQRRENRDDRNDTQQFEERECALAPGGIGFHRPTDSLRSMADAIVVSRTSSRSWSAETRDSDALCAKVTHLLAQ